MSWPHKQIVTPVIHILMLLLVVAVAGDGFTLQNVSLQAIPALQQALCNDDPGDDNGHHVWKASTHLSRIDNDALLLQLVIKNYLEQFNGLLIPSPPSIFFQPDRAPPISCR